MAFQKFSFRKGYFGSPWVGFEHFKYLFSKSRFMNAFWNTWIINSLRIIFGFPAPIILALLINEVRHAAYKRVVQTVSYLPHFIGWVILAGIFNMLLARDTGALNGLLASIGIERIDFLQDNRTFRWVLVFTDIWKEVGWGTIIYLATIAGINPELYESAVVDGAGRFKQMIYITLPSLVSTMVVLLLLRLGSILAVGFDQIYNLYSPLVYETGDIIQTYIVRQMTTSPVWSRLAAAGFIQSLIGMVLLLLANRLIRFTGREGIY
jgi:putative aldouronate transport system permease protein